MRPLGFGTAALEIQPDKHNASASTPKPPRARWIDHNASRNSSPLEAITAPTTNTAMVSIHVPLAKPPIAILGDVTPPSTHTATSTRAIAPSGNDPKTITGTIATNVAAACQ